MNTALRLPEAIARELERKEKTYIKICAQYGKTLLDVKEYRVLVERRARMEAFSDQCPYNANLLNGTWKTIEDNILSDEWSSLINPLFAFFASLPDKTGRLPEYYGFQ